MGRRWFLWSLLVCPEDQLPGRLTAQIPEAMKKMRPGPFHSSRFRLAAFRDDLIPMDNDAFENRRLAVMEEDHAQQQQESCHCADGHNNNPTPMMVLVHNSSNGAPLALQSGRFRLVRCRLELRRYIRKGYGPP